MAETRRRWLIMMAGLAMGLASAAMMTGAGHASAHPTVDARR